MDSKSNPPSGFADALKRLRGDAGITQAELAARAGMHKIGVAKLEQGQREPSWATVQALAKALGVECTAFNTPAPAPEPEPPAPKARKKK